MRTGEPNSLSLRIVIRTPAHGYGPRQESILYSDIKGIQPAFRAGKVELTEQAAATIPASRLLAVTSTFCGADIERLEFALEQPVSPSGVENSDTAEK